MIEFSVSSYVKYETRKYLMHGRNIVSNFKYTDDEERVKSYAYVAMNDLVMQNRLKILCIATN